MAMLTVTVVRRRRVISSSMPVTIEGRRTFALTSWLMQLECHYLDNLSIQ
jgi:hypothetical protein